MKKTQKDRELERDASPAFKDPYLNLCAAVILQAVRDAKSDDPEERFDAIAWLGGQDALTFAGALGLGDIFRELVRGRACLPGKYSKGSRR